MKKTLVIAIALASFAAFAQTEAQPATTTTESAAPAAKEVAAKPAKKAKKMKKKKSSTGAALKTEAKAVVADVKAIAAPAAVDTTREIASNSDVRVETAAAAAGTSTATTAATATEDKKWSASFVTQATASNDVVRLPLSEVPVDTINYVGAGYKISADTKLGFRQYFSYNIQPNQVAKGNAQWSVATLGTKFKGIAGSEGIAPLFWYYMPTREALKNVYNTNAGEITDHYGILRMDAEIVWTLNPKWQISYYLNPRQSIVAKQAYSNVTTGKKSDIESTTTLIHYGYLYYNVTDTIQPYASVGMDSRMTTQNFRSVKDHALLAVGASFSMLGGKVILNPEIGNEVALKDDGQYASAPRWLQAEDITYQFTGAVTF